MWVLFGIIAGSITATIVNLAIVRNIEKTSMVIMRVVSYLVCVVLGIGFFFFSHLRPILDQFIDSKISQMESSISTYLPDIDIWNTNIPAPDLSSFFAKLDNIIKEQDTQNKDFFEKIVLDTFNRTLSGYIEEAEGNYSKIATFTDSKGKLTVNSILENIKRLVLDKVSPYFVLGKCAMLGIFILYIVVYICIVVYLKKGGALYNQSITFGEMHNNA